MNPGNEISNDSVGAGYAVTSWSSKPGTDRPNCAKLGVEHVAPGERDPGDNCLVHDLIGVIHFGDRAR